MTSALSRRVAGVVNRILLGGQTRELCVAMDAPINPGNNGGPVLNVQGQLVGVACSGTQVGLRLMECLSMASDCN